MQNVERAKKPARLPAVLTRDEVHEVFAHLHGTARLMAGLLYGSGLRLMECVRLRVKDIDFGYARITVRDAMLPVNIAAALQLHLQKITLPASGIRVLLTPRTRCTLSLSPIPSHKRVL